jgi:hypothetical protein
MPWIRLDDQFPDHPKVIAAGPMAAWLHVCGIGYCNRLLTDGLIPKGQVRKLADADDAMALATRLVEVGLWEEVEGGYRIHDFLDYQPSAEQVKAERADNAKRQHEWRERKKQERNAVTNTVTDGVSNAPRNAPVTGAPYPSRTHPDPVNDQDQESTPPIPPAPSPSKPSPPSGGGRTIHPVPRPTTLNAAQQERFDRWYPDYPNKQHRPAAEKAFAKLNPDDDLTDRLIADVAARRGGRKWQAGYIEEPARYLTERVWEDDIEPVRAVPARASPNGQPLDPLEAQFGHTAAKGLRNLESVMRGNHAG